MTKEIYPIAFFHSPFPTKFGIPRQSGLVDALKGTIDFEEPYGNSMSLKGLEDCEYLWIIWGFSENDGHGYHDTVRPPRLGGNERVGVFASRSPFRPNGLGLSAVRILGISEGSIAVAGADLMDGTPIYDVKPYVAYSDAHAGARSGFTDWTAWHEAEVDFPEGLQQKFAGLSKTTDTEKALIALRKTLAQKPIPQYSHDSGRIYGMPFMGCDIRFRVEGNCVTIIDIDPEIKQK